MHTPLKKRPSAGVRTAVAFMTVLDMDPFNLLEIIELSMKRKRLFRIQKIVSIGFLLKSRIPTFKIGAFSLNY